MELLWWIAGGVALWYIAVGVLVRRGPSYDFPDGAPDPAEAWLRFGVWLVSPLLVPIMGAVLLAGLFGRYALTPRK